MSNHSIGLLITIYFYHGGILMAMQHQSASSRVNSSDVPQTKGKNLKT
jgi:hypothetical protein